MKVIAMLDTRNIHSMSDFVRNPRAHVARMKQTHTPEVLTINGRAEVVVLDTETYENLMERLQSAEAMASLRVHMAQAKNSSTPDGAVTEEDIQRSKNIMLELVEETERLGLYQ